MAKRQSIVVFVLLFWVSSLLYAARDWQGTNTAAAVCTATEALACSTETVVCGTPDTSQADETGTADSTALSLTIAAEGATCMCAFIEADTVNDTSWASGTWVLAWEVTVADTATWDNVDVCRMNAACSSVLDGSVANATSLAISLNSTGVKSTSQSGSSQTAGATDIWLVTFGCIGNGAHGNDSPDVQWSQLIETPLDALAPAGNPSLVNFPLTF